MPARSPRSEKHRCPRCKSSRLQRRLDGSSFCKRCGQRVASDGRLIPSADRRGDDARTEPQLNLL
ncbi:MAG: hypothetical protein JXA24_04375 [Proteobacteria bacterium]|nr:hypothetical protein [Pseudomonadota bacterium]